MAEEPQLARRCATHDLSSGDRYRMAEEERKFIENTRFAEASLDITIPVYFIHIVDGADGRITQSQRIKQLDVMNEAFADMGIQFAYDEQQVAEVDNPQFFRMGHGSARERLCKRAHQAVDPTEGLNFYTAAPGGNLLGWATFPHDMEGDPEMDGVVMLHSTLPEGTGSPYNLGKTGVHEIGHWLGLYHTFQDGCHGDGDLVDDTPPHDGPNFKKPADSGQPHNLCIEKAPAGSLCPIHNYMNYVDDEWMTEFTQGQKDRVQTQIGMFRADLLAGDDASRQRVEASGYEVIW